VKDQGENCIRLRKSHGNEYLYIFYGDNFVDAVIPFENRPENQNTRMIVDSVCKEATKLMRGK
jgi:hypothetical protein